MANHDRALDNPINWSFRIGRAFAIDIRIHFTFLLGAVVLIAMELPGPGSGDPRTGLHLLGDALLTYAMLFGLVLLHEFGHCFGARRTGGEASEILLWPLGGLATVQPPHHPKAQLLTTLAGPAVNLLVCLLVATILIAWTGRFGVVPWNPLHPFVPVSAVFFPTLVQSWLIRLFGLSYVLLLINLLPIFPFDGGRVVQAILWPKRGYRASMEIATGLGMLGAIVVGLSALFLDDPWLLLMIAVFGYITCWQNRRVLREQGDFETGYGMEYHGGYGFGGDAQPVERKQGFLERRRQRKAAIRAEQERKQSAQHELEVEEALRQVSIGGLESLTPRQRRALEEETRLRRARGGSVNEIS